MSTDIAKLRADAANGRIIVGRLCSELRVPKMSIPVEEDDEDQILCRVCEQVPALLAEVEQLRAEVAVHRKMRGEIRDWWSFDNQQWHTHNWHSREDFIEKWNRLLEQAGAKS